MGDTGRLLRSTFEARRIQLPARVTSIPLDADGKSSGYVLAEISGQAGVKVRIGPSDNYYPGDWIAAEQVGGGAGAQYVAAGFVAGTRPQSGAWEITSQITIGSETFDAGDVVFGNPYDSHWWYDYSVGRWNVRQANATRGALGPLADTYDYALGSPALGFVFGDYTDTWIAGDDVNGFRIFSGAAQRVALNTDGSGWFVDADVFSWDTAGNLTLAGNFQANSLRIGERAAGPAIRGGEVIELDSLGDPLPEDTERYGLRIYDETGLPKIALLTGTYDNPDVPAALFGAAGDPNYLWYKDGLLRLKGEAIIDGGQLGGYAVTDKRITALNNRIILVNENDAAYEEGLLLITGDTDVAGSIAWRKSAGVGHEDDWAGIVTTLYSAYDGSAKKEARMLIGVSDLFTAWNDRPCARLRLEASTPTSGGTKAYLQLVKLGGLYGWDDEMRLETNAEVRAQGGLRTSSVAPATENGTVTLAGIVGATWIGPSAFAWFTTYGTSGRLAANGNGLQCVSAGYPMFFELNIPQQMAGRDMQLDSLELHYSTAVARAYIASVSLLQQVPGDAPNTLLTYDNDLGNGSTGAGMAQLLDTALSLPAYDHRPLLLKVTLAGVTDYGQVVIHGFLAQWRTV
ncbi:MAG TPA: hypothetical protein PKW83_13680 [Verrucomicrobiota bacterium]|nr:hypothetical protein [Verrucomicrobiota bacterium]